MGDAMDRARKIKETLAANKNTDTTPVDTGEDKIDIKALDASLNNHKPFPEQEAKVEGEVVNGNNIDWTEVEEVPADKVIPPVQRPSAEKLEERGYAKANTNTLNPNEQEPIIGEPSVVQPANPTINTDGTKTGDSTSTSTSNPEPPKPKVEPINKDYGDMSPSEKRKNAEKTAEVLLTNYAQILPIVPKMLSKYNISKMEVLDMKGDIRLSMQVNEEGLTIRDYMMFENEKADKVFTVTEEMKDEIRPALIDVIMEKGAVMTPMNRLLSAVGGQVVLFLHASGKMFMEHRAAMKTFKDFKAQERAGFGGENKNNNNGSNNNNDNYSPNNPVNNPPVTPQNNGSNNSHDANIITEEKNVKIEDAIILQSSEVQIIEEK